jgi:hypothetical protein
MSTIPDWEKFIVPQKRPNSGCIPTGFEILLRAAGIEGINYETFQDEFDLDKDRKPQEQPKNDFDSVSLAVQKKYPNVNFKRISFPKGKGEEKLNFVEEQITKHRLILVSIALLPIFNVLGWHIMPVVDIDKDNLTLLYSVETNGRKQILKLKRLDFISIHNNFDGGDDVAFLET